MTYKLFLDDERQPYDVKWVNIHIDNRGWHIVRSYKEFVDYITAQGLPDFVTFDHDLADMHYAGDYTKEYTGMECAEWLVQYCKDNNLTLPRYMVHSMNPVGKQRILSVLQNGE